MLIPGKLYKISSNAFRYGKYEYGKTKTLPPCRDVNRNIININHFLEKVLLLLSNQELSFNSEGRIDEIELKLLSNNKIIVFHFDPDDAPEIFFDEIK